MLLGQTNTDMKLWDISIEMVENDLFMQKGMIISEVIEADNAESALKELMRLNSITNKENIQVLRNREYE